MPPGASGRLAFRVCRRSASMPSGSSTRTRRMKRSMSPRKTSSPGHGPVFMRARQKSRTAAIVSVDGPASRTVTGPHASPKHRKHR